jgi:tol-pal system protein YbgF
VSSEELAAYRSGYSAWSRGDVAACIDQFRSFLQTHPASTYADDAAYWMADCHFKNGDLRSAVLRFADVVERYPTGNKAADALYRQGEALQKLGPTYGKAARTAFERVVKEYPDSARVGEAKKQLELLKAG